MRALSHASPPCPVVVYLSGWRLPIRPTHAFSPTGHLAAAQTHGPGTMTNLRAFAIPETTEQSPDQKEATVSTSLPAVFRPFRARARVRVSEFRPLAWAAFDRPVGAGAQFRL